MFGSYLRQKVFNDIDLIIVHYKGTTQNEIKSIKNKISQCFSDESFDFIICSEDEFQKMDFIDDNRIQVF